MKMKKLLLALPLVAILACTGTQAVLSAHASGEEDVLPATESTFTKEHWHFDFRYDKTEVTDDRDVCPMPLPFYPDCPGNHTKPAPAPGVTAPDANVPQPVPMPRPMPYRG